MPVNRMSLEGELPLGGNWLGSNQENLVLTPSIAGPGTRGIKSLAARHAVSDRTYPHRWRSLGRPCDRPKLDYAFSDAGSTCTPGPMVELTATRFT